MGIFFSTYYSFFRFWAALRSRVCSAGHVCKKTIWTCESSLRLCVGYIVKKIHALSFPHMNALIIICVWDQWRKKWMLKKYLALLGEGDRMGVDVERMCESVHISTQVYFLYKQETVCAFLKSRFLHAHSLWGTQVLNTVFKYIPASQIYLRYIYIKSLHCNGNHSKCTVLQSQFVSQMASGFHDAKMGMSGLVSASPVRIVWILNIIRFSAMSNICHTKLSLAY